MDQRQLRLRRLDPNQPRTSPPRRKLSLTLNPPWNRLDNFNVLERRELEADSKEFDADRGPRPPARRPISRLEPLRLQQNTYDVPHRVAPVLLLPVLHEAARTEPSDRRFKFEDQVGSGEISNRNRV